jgi:hypothetical protein
VVNDNHSPDRPGLTTPPFPRSQTPRRRPLPTPQFPCSHGRQQSPNKCPESPRSPAASSDVFGDLVDNVGTYPPSQRAGAAASDAQPSSLISSQSLVRHASPRPTETPRHNAGISIFDNEIHELDPRWPKPVYPLAHGESSTDNPLSNIAISPKQYYVIFKGLRLGVDYDVW